MGPPSAVRHGPFASASARRPRQGFTRRRGRRWRRINEGQSKEDRQGYGGGLLEVSAHAEASSMSLAELVEVMTTAAESVCERLGPNKSLQGPECMRRRHYPPHLILFVPPRPPYSSTTSRLH
eukprot:2834931-Pyramimonas_sp.AAC.1